MNKENAHLYLPLVQALAEGKTIQHWVGQHWVDCKNDDGVQFIFPPNQYRIANEPRKPIELLVWVREDGTPILIAHGHTEGDRWSQETARLFREVTNQ
jgi:hypothetical protein